MFSFVSDEIFFCNIKEVNMMINGALVLNSRPRVKELKRETREAILTVRD